jgi:hypothetical protein
MLIKTTFYNFNVFNAQVSIHNYYHALISVVVHPLIKYLLIICDRQEWIVETWDCTTSLLSVERIRFENSILK